jgi:MFS family permease
MAPGVYANRWPIRQRLRMSPHRSWRVTVLDQRNPDRFDRMLSVLTVRTYRHLFLAQVIALVGTGLATVALGLLAFDLAGADAGTVLGTALAIKMIAYVGVAPIATAFSERWPRRTMLVLLDVVRAVTAAMLPFVTELWQVYLLIFVLQAASAAFTPCFQATIPDVLPREDDYTRALSLSRVAYDLESLISPLLAAALLTVVSFHELFAGTALGFLGSAALVLTVTLPATQKRERHTIYERTTRGVRIYLATPRLRGLLALNLAAAAAGSMVIVNTVVLVQSTFDLSQKHTAIALGAFGGGSLLAALLLPRLLESVSDRQVMIIGALLLVAGLCIGPLMTSYSGLLMLWIALGLAYSLTQTPSGRLLRRSSHAEDRPAIFAAQFALSHACWLLTYPLAGWVGATLGLPATFALLAGIALFGLLAARAVWPRHDPEQLEHVHRSLDASHPHIADADHTERGFRHRHAYVIDSHHPEWPTSEH